MKRFLFIAAGAALLSGALFLGRHSFDKEGSLSQGGEIKDGSPPSLPRDKTGIRENTRRAPSSKAIFVAGNGVPKGSGLLEQLEKDSDGKWSLQRSEHGFVSRMTGGALSLGTRAPTIAAAEFLKRYGAGLLGVGEGQLAFRETRQDEAVSQVIFEQVHESLPIFGSRLNMIFDREGQLIYLLADLYPGSFPSFPPRVGAREASQIVMSALAASYAEAGAAFEGKDLLSTLESQAQPGFRLDKFGIKHVIRFEFSVVEPSSQDWEAIVDAETADLVVFRKLSKQ